MKELSSQQLDWVVLNLLQDQKVLEELRERSSEATSTIYSAMTPNNV